MSVSGNLYTVLAVVVSLFAMCLLPFFFALLFRDIGKTLAVPMVLFFLMIFLMNGVFGKARTVKVFLRFPLQQVGRLDVCKGVSAFRQFPDTDTEGIYCDICDIGYSW